MTAQALRVYLMEQGFRFAHVSPTANPRTLDICCRYWTVAQWEEGRPVYRYTVGQIAADYRLKTPDVTDIVSRNCAVALDDDRCLVCRAEFFLVRNRAQMGGQHGAFVCSDPECRKRYKAEQDELKAKRDAEARQVAHKKEQAEGERVAALQEHLTRLTTEAIPATIRQALLFVSETIFGPRDEQDWGQTARLIQLAQAHGYAAVVNAFREWAEERRPFGRIDYPISYFLKTVRGEYSAIPHPIIVKHFGTTMPNPTGRTALKPVQQLSDAELQAELPRAQAIVEEAQVRASIRDNEVLRRLTPDMEELRRRDEVADLFREKIGMDTVDGQPTAFCPWHRERTTRFHVVTDDRPYRFFCYSCRRGGDIFEFLTRLEPEKNAVDTVRMFLREQEDAAVAVMGRPL